MALSITAALLRNKLCFCQQEVPAKSQLLCMDCCDFGLSTGETVGEMWSMICMGSAHIGVNCMHPRRLVALANPIPLQHFVDRMAGGSAAGAAERRAAAAGLNLSRLLLLSTSVSVGPWRARQVVWAVC